jgi:hypothetical protein
MSYSNAELAQATQDFIIGGLPLASEVSKHITNTRTYDTDSLFAGEPVLCTEGGYGTQIFLERGVRMNILLEMTGKSALNQEWNKEWNTLFDRAFNNAQYGE